MTIEFDLQRCLSIFQGMVPWQKKVIKKRIEKRKQKQGKIIMTCYRLKKERKEKS